jgi:IS30 family transposase
MNKKKSVGEQKKYTHIKKAERLEIAILLEKRYSIREIAKAMKRSPNIDKTL